MKKLWTLKKVLEALGITYGTLYRWRKNGMFPESVGIGKLLWREDQIIEWMNRQSKSQLTVTAPVKQKGDKKAFDQRQAAATAVLERHAAKK